MGLVLLLKCGVGRAKLRRHGLVDVIKIELAPGIVGLDGWERPACIAICRDDLSSRLLLPFHATAVSGVELDATGRQVIAEKTRLLLSKSGERVVVLACTGLAVADEIDVAHARPCARPAARETSAMARVPKS